MAPQLICDHYVVNRCKSQFIYMAYNKECKGYCLTKQFLHTEVFPRFPEIYQKMQDETLRQYQKNIFKPIMEEKKLKFKYLNKKSNYRRITLIDKEQGQTAANLDSSMEIKNKIAAERETNQYLTDTIQEVQDELTKMSEHIRSVMEDCESKLEAVLSEIQSLN